MNRSFLLAMCTISLRSVVMSQPTLTEATNAPVVGTTINLNYSPAMPPGSAGANALWDFSTLPVDSTDVVQWVLPSATVNGALFPSAEVAELWDVIAYSEVDPTGLYVVGSDEQGTIVTYSDPRLALPFPCTYQTGWNDPFAGTYNVLGLDVERTGTYGGTADGYGELIMPWGTVPDVLRIHVQAAQQDSTAFGTLFLYIDAYQFFVVGNAWPVAQVVTTTAVSIGGTFTAAYTLWMDGMSTGTPAASTAEERYLLIAPIPASEVVNIRSNKGWEAGTVLRIHDAQGRIVIARKVPSAGPTPERIDVTALSPGCYSVTAIGPNGELARAAFVVTR